MKITERRLIRAVLLAEIMLALGACPAATDSPPLASFCDTVGEAWAARLSACYGGPRSTWESTLLLEREVCMNWQSGITAGRIKYDATQAAACASSSSALDCLALRTGQFAFPAACQAAIQGTVAEGGVCFTDVDCAGAGKCEQASACTAGTCVAATSIPAGERCQPTKACVVGYRCVAGTCMPALPPPLGLGQSCVGDPFSVHCDAGLGCDGRSLVCARLIPVAGHCLQFQDLCEAFSYCSSTTGTCVTPPAAGDACGSITSSSEAVPCQVGNRCKLAANSGIGTCVAQAAVGGACTFNEDCLSDDCQASTGTCMGPCAEQ
jgi:hypothetical protein